MTAFGTSPLGTELGPSGGPGLITVLGVLPLTTTSFAVVFDRAPFVFDSERFDAGSNASNYELTTIDPTIYPPLAAVPTVPPGEVVPTRSVFPVLAGADRDDPKQVIVQTDARMDPRVQHVVHISDRIVGIDGEAFAGQQDWKFRSPGLSPTAQNPAQQSLDKYRDFAWQFESDAGVWRYDATNDIGLNGRMASLRSRIYRRIFTSPGGFAWLPTYGVGASIKGLAQPSKRQELADLVADQAQLEPEVVEASADVSFEATTSGGVVQIALYLRIADGTSSRISYTEQVSGG